jgi:integrase
MARQRARKGTGCIDKFKPGTYRGRLIVGHSETGKPKYKAVYGQTPEEVRKKMREVQTELDEGEYKEPSKMTVGEWLAIWLEDYNTNVKERTRIKYAGTVRTRIIPALGKVKLVKLNPHMIQQFYNNSQTEGGEQKALCAKSVRNMHGILHKALEQAVKNEYISRNPARCCELPRAQKPNITPFDEAGRKTLLVAVQGHKYEAIYKTALFTGLRQGEILGLTWDCTDFGSGQILVKQQLQRTGREYKLVPTKNGKARTIRPAKAIIKILIEQKMRQSSEKAHSESSWNNPLNLVFTNESGGCIGEKTVYDNFKKICREIGCPEKRFHDLRHTYAVMSLEAGEDIKTLQENLGHHSAAFTLDRYGHVSERMKTDSAERMERVIKALVP